MSRLTEVAQAEVLAVLQLGEAAIDATAGNGHDTCFLCERVGSTGRVFAFDIQTEALARTVEATGESANLVLIHLDHAGMRDAIPTQYHGRIGAIMFNLGYLPGGNKNVTTQTDSTVHAVSASLELLRPGGVLTVLAYTGHPGGVEEAEAVERLLERLSNTTFIAREYRSEPDSATTPRLFAVHKSIATG
jgi:predicted methyltransferase